MINLTFPSNLPSELQGVQLIDVRESLPVNPRYTWKQLKGIRPVSDLTTIVFHHDAIPKQESAGYTDIQLASRISTAHINSKKNLQTGDPGFPYDLWIRNGILYFTNYIEAFEFGVAANNKYTVNVCVSGAYHKDGGDDLTDADRKALYVAFFLLKGVMPAYKALKGHKEITPTQCPGYDMNRVRDDLKSLESLIAISATWKDKVREVNRIMSLFSYYAGKINEGENSGDAKWAMRRAEDTLGFLKSKKYL